jgi:LAGLIDADG DNA endonuclease family
MIDTDSRALSFVSSQILGDGSVRNGRALNITHATPWRDYLEVKKELARSLGFMTSEIKDWNSIGSLGPQSMSGITVHLPNENMAISSLEVLIDRLDEMGLLLWWLDDGCMVVHEKKNGTSVARFGYLGTEAFDQATNIHLSQILFNKFGLSSSVHIDRGGIVSPDAIYYRLYFNATTMRQFIDIIRPWLHLVPPSMLYKLNMQYRPTRLSTSAEYARLYNF